MGKVIGIISIKGGVGKTTVSASLATDLANHYKKKVLLVDANYSAPNLGLHMDVVEPDKTIHDVLSGHTRIQGAIHKKYGVDVIPGSYVYTKRANVMKLKDRLSTLKDQYDFIILDSSPSLNEEVLSTIVASDSLFVVSTPDYPTLSCSLRAAQLAKQRGRPVSGIIVNKIRDPDYELSLADIEDATSLPVIAMIHDDPIHVRSLFTRIPATIYKRKSRFSREITSISAALTGMPEQMPWYHKVFNKNFRKEQVNRQLLKDTFYDSVFKNPLPDRPEEPRSLELKRE